MRLMPHPAAKSTVSFLRRGRSNGSGVDGSGRVLTCNTVVHPAVLPDQIWFQARASVCRGTISVLKARQRTAVSLTVEQHGGPTVFV
jgi:hypothetical protein